MNKCSPVVMRENLLIVESLKKAGVDFVAIPVLNDSHKLELRKMVNAILERMAIEAEEEEGKS